MKTQNRNLLLLFWLSSATLILTACGGGDDPSDDAPPPSPSPPPTANATAHAGSDQDISIAQSITLDGSSTDPDGDTLSYSWTQLSGPDVTGGSGTLTGESPSFTAPNRVSTLQFELRVNDGHGDSPADLVQINILEDVARALFVDGNTGSDDTGDGTRDNPFATLGYALNQLTPEQEDIYVMALNDDAQHYDESSATLIIPDGTSLYGGFTTNWVRDVKLNPSRLLGAAAAIKITTISNRTWFSGFDLQTVNAQTPAETIYAISVQHGPMGILTIEDNTINTGHAANGRSTTPGNNYGVRASNLAGLEVYRNTLAIGNAANGSVGIDGVPGNDGSNAINRSGYLGDAGGSNGGPGSHGKGGDGGNGDEGNAYVASWENGDNATGARAGTGGQTIRTDDADGGKSGTAGNGGNGGGNGLQLGLFDSTGYLPANGLNGRLGAYGGNGGGGRGGSTSGALDGGGGGGGGGGGEGGAGGLRGMGGGASIGIYTYAISGQVNLYDNTITAGKGGLAGKGGRGGKGGDAGNATSGANGACASLGCAWSQAGGGGGGGGGTGGSGGGGGGGGSGGPSIAVVIGTGISAIINNNRLGSANAGGGGQAGELGLLGFAGNGGNGSTGFNGNGNGDPGEAGDTGNYGKTGQGGHGGWSYAIFDVVIEVDDGLVPSLFNNTFSVGQAGTAGGADGNAGQSGEANFSF